MNSRWLRADAWILPETLLFNEAVMRRVLLQVEKLEAEALNGQIERPGVMAEWREDTPKSTIDRSCRISAQNSPLYCCGATTLTKSFLRTRVPRAAKPNPVQECQMSRITVWSEKLNLRPFEITPSLCCLEPDEAVSIKLTATYPVTSELLGWRSYLRRERRDAAMSAKLRFTAAARTIKHTATAKDPPYTVVLLISNPGRENAHVLIEVTREDVAVGNAAHGRP
jgi:hypothetical protein